MLFSIQPLCTLHVISKDSKALLRPLHVLEQYLKVYVTHNFIYIVN